ncbi:MAG TPA: MBL fold metallo-hydrolase [Opitutaceae bacterium]|nr:MBL fold metallo-hydrolase [Opitutaceae bacterium]
MIFDGQGCPLPPAQKPAPDRWSNDAITGSCLGHSTVLLNFFGVRILTDPVFSTRVGPRFGPLVIGPKRRIRPALHPREFAPPDVIVLSHAHFDHFDVASLRKFPRDTPVVTAAGTGDLLRRFRNVHELAWGNTATLNTRSGNLKITALPVEHWGARMLRDSHRGYNGYLLERSGHAICFGGDTAFTRMFASLYDPRRPIDLAIMPVGAYDPWIRAHCSPEQAVTMARDAGAAFFVPIHHETFRLSHEPMTEPAIRLRKAFRDAPERLLAVRVGETFHVPLEHDHSAPRARVGSN